MCGVVAVRDLAGRPVPRGLVAAMSATLSHRGPDDDGEWHAGDASLAHRRLAIIDPSGARQPMVSADGRLAIAFNGEILNHARLGRDLGVSARSDTAVLLAGLAAEGLGFLDRVRGQFAFVLVDAEASTLLAARDPLGILPLYYALDGSRLLIASEVKALLVALPGTPAIDVDSLDDYLMRRAVPAPHTLLQGVHKVLPGHALRVDAAGRVEQVRYWHPPSRELVRPMDPRAAVARLSSRLDTAVRRCLVADVPVGTYLSGGLDSSVVTALATRHHPGIHSFAAGFGDPRVDELPAARGVADLLGTRHHEVLVGPGDFIALWTDLTRSRDAPLSEPADVAVYGLARAAREHVRVVLSGEGSDELFAGYPKYRAARAVDAAGRLPLALRRSAAGALELVAQGRRTRAVSRALRARDAQDRQASWFAPFLAEERERILRTVSGHRPSRGLREPSADVIEQMLDADLVAWLPDNLLERGDRMTMAASVELRPPFLDLDVVDLALRMPASLKVRGSETKWPVRQVARTLLPPDVAGRAKAGFRVPLDAWFRSELRPMARDLLSARDSLAAGLLDRAAVARVLSNHEAGRANEDLRLWTLVSLEVWWRQVREDARASPRSHGAAGGRVSVDAAAYIEPATTV